MRGKHFAFGLSLICSSLAFATPVNATDAQDCIAILESLRHEAQSGLPASFVVTLQGWLPPVMTAAEARTALQRIEGLPDHPDRERLEAALRDAEAEGWQQAETVWYFGPDRMRYSAGDPGESRPGPPPIDLGVHGSDRWSLAHNQIALFHADAVAPNMDHARTITRKLTTSLGFLASAGAFAHVPDARLDDCSVEDGVWTAIWTMGDGQTRHRVRGEIAPDGSLRTLSQQAISLPGDRADQLGGSIRFSEHRYTSVFNREIPFVREFINAAGAVTKRERILRLEPVDPAMADRLTAVPTREHPDPVRGTIDYDIEVDWRSGQPAVGLRPANGPVQRIERAGAASPPGFSVRAWLLIVAAAVFVGVAALAVRRVRTALL